ncbi:hypothetical protein DSO57_1013803, partial [Entomophthora muscae]
MNRESHSQPAPAPARGAACPQGRPRGSKNRPRTQLKGSNADTQASQGISASQSPPASQARNSLPPKSLIVNSLPPLALDRTVFPRRTKKTAQSPAKPLNSLNDLAHTVDERFVLAYPAGPLALVAPAWEETLVNLDYLLAWYHPLLKTIRNAQSNGATSTTTKSTRSEMLALPSSQPEGVAEITLEPSSPPGPGQQKFSSAQSNATLEA